MATVRLLFERDVKILHLFYFSAFLIFPEETSHYNVDSLNGQAQHKKLRESVEQIQHRIGDKIFHSVLR